MYSNDAPGTVRARSEYTYHDVVNDDIVPLVSSGDGPMPVFTSVEAMAVTPGPRKAKLAAKAAIRAQAESDSRAKRAPSTPNPPTSADTPAPAPVDPAPVMEGASDSAEPLAPEQAPKRCGRPPRVPPPPAETGRPETAEEFARRTANHFVLRGPQERKEGGNTGGNSEPSEEPTRNAESNPRSDVPEPSSSTVLEDDWVYPLPDSSLVEVVESSAGSDGLNFLNEVRRLSLDDPILKPVIEKPSEFRNFSISNGLVYLKDRGRSLLCIPNGLSSNGRSLREIVISEAHSLLAHLGASKTLSYLRDHVYWKDLVSNVKAFCDTCHTCKQNKPDNQRPYGILNPLPVPSYPWEAIGVDFVGPLPDSSNRDGTFDSITVIIDLLTSMVHLVPSRTNYDAKQIAELMFEEVYKLHGLPRKIISDRDVLFTSTFWQRLNDLIGPKLKMSSAYHPQTDGSTERANRTLVQMLRELVNSKQTNWVQCIPAIEFAINSAKSDSTGFSPFFLNNGRVPRAMIWNSAPQTEFPAVRNFALTRKLALMSAHDSIIAARVKQTRDANQKRRLAPFVKGDLVYLSTKNISFPKGLARKLIPRYIGPYRILEDFGNQSFRLDLSSDLKQRGVHDVFHASLLRAHSPNDDRLFPGRLDTQISTGSDNPDSEWAIEKILSHSRSGEDAIFEILWKAGDITWLPYHEISHLPALRMYLDLLLVENIGDLPIGKGQPPRENIQALLA